ncbi:MULTISPECIES: HU family DNA-binding protein [Alistipes]|uniref:HU family DNA-binding protein n=2 Tax=Alistipes TaxID=239759 RepID=A0ABY5VAQ4_9BACT|nr:MULTISPECIES: HU family DNA-binding protein [Alistipes]MBQ7894123.1 HU family DNA-binding protein [Alistipes sp.]MBR2218596.1 HU family DNA-binding protein [Alistipes sp.]MBS5526452.1 HU family DNA-binding protein [Alistipes sp.]MCI7306637.1 HU family DNA-binding protein [Alistipes senegalensis]MDD7039584.1 HU family DNA-binding protein [Alistipes senegalensis]
MNKAQFVEAIALDANIPKVEARKAIDAMIRVTVQSLREGERLTLTGLGTFNVQQRPERVGRNPRTGAAVKIPPRKVIKFRPSVEIE